MTDLRLTADNIPGLFPDERAALNRSFVNMDLATTTITGKLTLSGKVMPFQIIDGKPVHDCTPLALHDDQKPVTCEHCGVYWRLNLNGPDGTEWVPE